MTVMPFAKGPANFGSAGELAAQAQMTVVSAPTLFRLRIIMASALAIE